MTDPKARSIFKKGSTTYFYSSIFFPESLKKDVFTFYSFVRTADDLVDAIPQDVKGFHAFVREYRLALRSMSVNNSIVTNFVALMREKAIDEDLVDAFLDAMESDLTKHSYQTLSEIKKYMFGSAEVIGIIMCKLMQLPSESYPYGAKLGRAMQYVNFLRDIKEDISLGRTYIPIQELKKFGLTTMHFPNNEEEKKNVIACIRSQIAVYRIWQKEAEEGFGYIPKRYKIAIKTASDMYTWTADTIYKDPLVVFTKKVKPSKLRIIHQAIRNSILQSV